MNRDALARAVSIIGHPFVMAAAAVMAGSATSRSLIFIAICIIPVAILMFVQVRRGKWTHVDASNRSERPALYIVGIVATLVAFAVTGAHMTRSIAIVLGMLVVLMIVTRWIKVSLHLTFAVLAASITIVTRPPVGWTIAALVPLLIWSRLHLRRHTPLEVALGCVAGAATGLVLHAVAI